ncbi:hypothetical protein [Methanobrevibacter sp.]|uniref:hypothetical protein n=1 Tax=Methanobrevibacter sp. TaxID=66852 RepID=UPI003890B07F
MAKKKEIDIEETAIIEDNEILVKEKQTWKLNAIESLAYEGMKGLFVGAFMVGDILGFNKKEDTEE